MAGSQPTASESTATGSGVAVKVKRIPGLQVILMPGSQPVRHIPFDIPPTETAGSKFISNKIHADGALMKNACTPCLAALAMVSQKHVLGRGMQNHNELFSCMSEATLGIGGTQCGRCVGLGKGGECSQPVAGAHKAAREVIKAIPGYNRALLSQPSTPVREMSDANQAAIGRAVAAAKQYSGTIDGLRKQGVEVSTPTKKRKAMHEESSSKLSELNSVFTRGQTGLESQLESLISTSKKQSDMLTYMSKQLAALERRSRTSRARERHIVDVVAQLGMQANALAVDAATARDGDPPARLNNVTLFNLEEGDNETDAELDSDED